VVINGNTGIALIVLWLILRYYQKVGKNSETYNTKERLVNEKNKWKADFINTVGYYHGF